MNLLTGRRFSKLLIALGLAAGFTHSIEAAPPLVILNEYNAVGPKQFLKGGRTDSAFGNRPMAGNGGSWVELLVIGSNPQGQTPDGTTVDMRGWSLEWQCRDWQNLDWQPGSTNAGNDPKTVSGTLKLSDDAFWQTIRSGTIITFTGNNAEQGGKDTDLNFDPEHGKWNVNIWIGSQALITTNGAAFKTSGHWQMTIKDETGAVVFGPAGDGIGPHRDVRSNEAFKLEEVHPEIDNDPGTSSYAPGGTSTFGQLNRWDGTNVQDASTLRAWLLTEQPK